MTIAPRRGGKILLLTLLPAALALAAMLRFWPARSRQTATAEHPRTAEALQVTAVAVTSITLDDTVTATGTLRPDEGIDLQAEVAGKIMTVAFHEGTSVQRGDLLVKINDADLRATLARATARLDLAERHRQRLAELWKSGSIHQEDLDTATSEVAVLRAESDLAEAQLRKTEIRAPFDGVVGLRFVSEGAFITTASSGTAKIATLQAIDRLKLDFALPEQYAPRLQLGRAVSFNVAGVGETFTGEIYALEPRIDIATRTILVRARCANPGARLLPGAFANVTVSLGKIEGAILIPSVAVIPGLTEKNVFVVQHDHAIRRKVETGRRTATTVQILSGLTGGEWVITSGIQQLRNDLPVKVRPDSMPVTHVTIAAQPHPSGPR